MLFSIFFIQNILFKGISERNWVNEQVQTSLIVVRITIYEWWKLSIDLQNWANQTPVTFFQ